MASLFRRLSFCIRNLLHKRRLKARVLSQQAGQISDAKAGNERAVTDMLAAIQKREDATAVLRKTLDRTLELVAGLPK